MKKPEYTCKKCKYIEGSYGEKLSKQEQSILVNNGYVIDCDARKNLHQIHLKEEKERAVKRWFITTKYVCKTNPRLLLFAFIDQHNAQNRLIFSPKYLRVNFSPSFMQFILKKAKEADLFDKPWYKEEFYAAD